MPIISSRESEKEWDEYCKYLDSIGVKKETEEVTEWKRRRPCGCDQYLEKHLDNVDLINTVGAGSAR